MLSAREAERAVVEVVRLECAVEGAWVRAARRDWVERISARSCFLCVVCECVIHHVRAKLQERSRKEGRREEAYDLSSRYPGSH